MNPIFVDSSVIVMAALEKGLTRAAERAVVTGSALVVSRLALVEVARALDRARAEKRVTDRDLVKVQASVEELFGRCEIWEVSRLVCNAAATIAPRSGLRTLDAIHLATFLTARKRLPTLRLLTSDSRMREAAVALGFRVVPP